MCEINTPGTFMKNYVVYASMVLLEIRPSLGPDSLGPDNMQNKAYSKIGD